MFGLKRFWGARRDKPKPVSVAGSALVAVQAPISRYLAAIENQELRQGEIITGLTYYVVKANPDIPGQFVTSGIRIPYAVIATPDCDLLHSFRAIRDSKPERINGVLFFEAEAALVARKRIPINTHQFRDVSRNRLEGYHLLTSFQVEIDPMNEQIPDLLIDFKRFFMLPSSEVYRQCQSPDEPKATRRCYLNDLWREDLQQRAMSFMQRVGTPDPED